MFVTKNKKHLFMFMPALLLFRLLGPSFQPPCKRPNPTSAKGRWCKLATVPPLHIPNETSSNLLEYLVMLSSTHVHNLARCSIVWNAKTPFLVIPRFVAKVFPMLYEKFTALYSVFDCRMIAEWSFLIAEWSFLIVRFRTAFFLADFLPRFCN